MLCRATRQKIMDKVYAICRTKSNKKPWCFMGETMVFYGEITLTLKPPSTSYADKNFALFIDSDYFFS